MAEWWEGVTDEGLREQAKGFGSLEDAIKKAAAPPGDWFDGISDQTLREQAKGLGSLDDVVKKATAEPPKAGEWYEGITDATLQATAKEKFGSLDDVLKAATAQPSETAWRDQLTDEKHKNVAERLNSPADAMQKIIDLNAAVSERIRVPGEGATEEDIAQFRKAIGVEEEDKYVYTPAEGQELSEQDENLVKAVMPLAHKHNVPLASMQAMMSDVMALNASIEEEAAGRINAEQDKAVSTLKKEWGQDYEANSNLANRVAVNEKLGGGDDFLEIIQTAKIGDLRIADHPVMLRHLSAIGRLVDEGDVFLGPSEEKRQSVQSQIDELNKKVPIGTAEYKTPAHQEKLQELYRQLGGGPIVGSGNRAA